MKTSLQQKYSISIIGSGNIAWHLSHALVKAGHFLNEIFSRNKSTAIPLASALKVPIQNSLDFSFSKSKIFILAVPDSSILEIASKILLPPDNLIISVSGSISLVDLKNIRKNSAVFYPLQTFSKRSKINFNEIPILIEAAEPDILDILHDLANSLTESVFEVDSVKREKIHLAAVFACNFTNYFLSVSKNILEKEYIDFNIMKPLVLETIQKAFLMGPKEGQTGPAARGDFATWESHLRLLNNEEDLRDIYNQISLQINKSVNNF